MASNHEQSGLETYYINEDGQPVIAPKCEHGRPLPRLDVSGKTGFLAACFCASDEAPKFYFPGQ